MINLYEKKAMRGRAVFSAGGVMPSKSDGASTDTI